MNIINENRRDFLRKAAVAVTALPLITSCRAETVAQIAGDTLLARLRRNGVSDNWTGASDVPETVSSSTVLSNGTDKGDSIEISGTVFQSDGKTAAAGTLIYLYHTDLEGFYGRRKDEHRHGRYRGWLLTDSNGRYSFKTIKPAPYPENRWAAHIHMTVTTETTREDWIDSILFEGDRLITPRERSEAGKRGGFNPILSFEKGKDGILRATRNIQLMV